MLATLAMLLVLFTTTTATTTTTTPDSIESDDSQNRHNVHKNLTKVTLQRTPFDKSFGLNDLSKSTTQSTIGRMHVDNGSSTSNRQHQRERRDNHLKGHYNASSNGSNFDHNEVGWSIINEEVDIVIPIVLYHLQQLGIEHLVLPNLKESISVKPLFITYTAGLSLYNGLVYNIAGIERNGDAMMTYKDKSFLCRFYLLINSLQFEYDFKIKLMAIDGYGKVVGSLDDTLIYADLFVNVEDTRLRLNDFRIVKFRNIRVHLDHIRLIRELTGVILSPITNLFRDRITTSISDGLKEQMQTFMDDFNDKDPLELRKFTKQMLSSLTGQPKD